MRLIGHLDNDRDARTFGDFLYVQGIETQFEQEETRWALWVLSDDQVAEADRWLAEFRRNPADERFQAGSPAARLRARSAALEESRARRVVEARDLFPASGPVGLGFVSLCLTVLAVGVFFASSAGENLDRISVLFINAIAEDGGKVSWRPGWGSVANFELWRLFTPALIHFGFVHLLFNLFWLKDLGSLYELRVGSAPFIVFVLVVTLLSNSAQYFIHGNPMFGGLSGLNYALIGYCWVRGRFDPGAGISLDQTSLVLALVWFALGFTEWVGPVANTVHTVGLVTGAVWALEHVRRSRGFRR